jgi:hypothetical protein
MFRLRVPLQPLLFFGTNCGCLIQAPITPLGVLTCSQLIMLVILSAYCNMWTLRRMIAVRIRLASTVPCTLPCTKQSLSGKGHGVHQGYGGMVSSTIKLLNRVGLLPHRVLILSSDNAVFAVVYRRT